MDKIIMLLSSDWFLPYWHLLGISIGERAKQCFQQECREIVQQIMDDAREYYNVSFAPERLQATRAMLTKSLRKCGLREDTFREIDQLILRDDEAGPRNFAWLLSTLTRKLLISDAMEDHCIDSDIRDAVATTYSKYNAVEVNFQRLSLNSASSWDRYLNGITPELPTALADYLSGLLADRSIRLMWGDLSRRLTARQQKDLRAWYRRTAETALGVDAKGWPADWAGLS